MASEKTFLSDLSSESFAISQQIVLSNLRQDLVNFILISNPILTASSVISVSELDTFRQEFLTSYVLQEVGELTRLEEDVLDAMGNKKLLSDDEPAKFHDKLTIGQKVSDKVAAFGGSWTFIISFIVFMIIWISLNAFWLQHKAFDAYPFILLNLMLSFVAALQAPVIMMSQNRQEEKDRDRAQQDYMINLKAELEIRILHEKIDHLAQFQRQIWEEVKRNNNK